MGNSRSPTGNPSYDKSVAIQVVQNPDPAAAGNAMINAFKNFSEGVSSIANAYTEQEAKQQRDIVKNNISNTYKEFSLQALRNPDQNAAIQDYNKSSREYSQQLLTQTNHFNRAYVGNLVDYYHNEHLYPIEKNAILQNQRQLSVEAYKRTNDATRDWQNSINNSTPIIDEKGVDHQFDASHALFADQLRNMEQDARNKLVDPATMGKARNELIKEYTTSVFLKKYEDSVSAGKGNEFIAHMRDPNFHIPGASEEDKYALAGKMIKIRDQGKRGGRIALGQLTDKMADELINVGHGAIPNVDLQSSIDALDPVRGERFRRQVEIKQGAFGAAQATQYMTPQEKGDYKRELLNIDYTKPDAAQHQRIADASIKEINAQDVKMKADPMAYVMQNPAIQDSVNTYEQAFNADAVGTDHMSTPFNSTVPKPWNDIIREQLNLGFTLNGSASGRVQLIEKPKVKGIINDLMTATPEDKLRYMDKLNEEYGGGVAFNLVMKQLQAAGLPPSYALMAGIDPNSPDRELVANAASVPATEVEKNLHAAKPSDMSAISEGAAKHVYGISNGTRNFRAFLSTLPQFSSAASSTYRNNLAAEIKQIANYAALTQGMSSTQAVAKAEDIIADRYRFTSINNSSIRLPKDIAPETIKSYAAEKRRELDNFQFNFDGVNRVDARIILSEGSWKNNDTDSGLVWVDKNGVMWTDHNGHPFGFSYHEAVTGEPDYLHPTVKAQDPANEEMIDSGIAPDQSPNVPEIALKAQKLDLKGAAFLKQAKEGKL